MAKYTLPDLPYDYGALEPHVSGRIMELHHDRHHAGYVQGANEALEQLDEARFKALEQLDEARFKADWTRLAREHERGKGARCDVVDTDIQF